MNRWRRALTSAVLLATVVSFGTLAATEPAAAGASCPPADPGTIRVGMVVDAGTGPVGVVCVVLPAGSTGRDALEARGRLLGRSLRWHDSGLLCAIDGMPQTGCGQANSDGYAYWSYWSGAGSTWTYSSLGPAFRRLKDGDVEGWRFLDGGSGTGADRAPRATVDEGRPSAPTTTLPPAPAPTAPAAQGQPGGAIASPPTTARPRPGAAPTTAAPASGAPAPPVTTPASEAAPTSVPDGGEATAPVEEPPGGTTTTTERSRPAVVDERAAAPAIAGSDDDSGSLAGVATAAGLVVVLGGLAVTTVARRRRDLDPHDPDHPLP